MTRCCFLGSAFGWRAHHPRGKGWEEALEGVDDCFPLFNMIHLVGAQQKII
ncbi:hypothetical protein CsSME_00023748 [Camellia sinensis var. sinensis]